MIDDVNDLRLVVDFSSFVQKEVFIWEFVLSLRLSDAWLI